VEEIEAGIMKHTYKRRQLFVHPVQYQFLATTLIYFALLLLVVYAVVFWPLMQDLDDPALSWEDRARVAEQFLAASSRVWPWIGLAFLVVLLHSIYFMHRIAGPLYRLKSVFSAVEGGQLSVRAKLRSHDYLHREADSLNVMLSLIEEHIHKLNDHCAAMNAAYEGLRTSLQQTKGSDVVKSLQVLEDEIRHFRTQLGEFKTAGKGDPNRAGVTLSLPGLSDTPAPSVANS
jgi:methyl-accepting chemotaxis protein